MITGKLENSSILVTNLQYELIFVSQKMFLSHFVSKISKHRNSVVKYLAHVIIQ